MKSARAYDNTTRREAMERHRREIREACIRLISRKGQEISIESVAREAGVSSRTIFRHFPTREILLREAWQEVLARTGMTQYPQTREDLLARIQPVFIRFDEHAELVRSMVLSETGWEIRMLGDQARREGLAKALREDLQQLPPDQQRQLAGIIRVLFSATTWQLLRDREGMTGEEAADAVRQAIETLLRSAASSPAHVHPRNP